MRILIAYASAHGFTEQCAKILADKLKGHEVSLIDLKVNPRLNVGEYEAIAIGGSIHAGSIQKQVTDFCRHNMAELLQKRVGLFITCADENNSDKTIRSVYPSELLAMAKVATALGASMNYEKLNFILRAIVRKISGTQQSFKRIYEDKIEEFAKALTA